MDKKFYVTTPIYYVNDIPHIGHAYTTLAADILARFYRSSGYDVHFLTGTDEHGLKVMEAAEARGITPQELVDQVVVHYLENWKLLNISNDDFIRTTMDFHEETVEYILKKLIQSGDIYKGLYKGYYCTPCETFLTKTQLIDEKCPECRRDVKMLEEENYFFRLSHYAPLVLEHIRKNPGFISPKTRENEIVSRLSGSEINDVSISRSSFDWGVNFPGDEKHVVYVWIDALINYISAVGYSKDMTKFESRWPAQVHLMAKDIVWFHTVIWPSLLMALEVELPLKCFIHGYWNSEGRKMSKSVGNVIDPRTICDEFGVDPFRYYLFREVPFGGDGNFVLENFKNRYRGELANDLGNLINRTVNMTEKYLGGVVGKVETEDPGDLDIFATVGFLKDSIPTGMAELEFSEILKNIWKLISSLNKYIDTSVPWTLHKNGDVVRLKQVFFTLISGFQAIAICINPFMPETAAKISKMIGIEPDEMKFENIDRFRSEYKVTRGEILFPKID